MFDTTIEDYKIVLYRNEPSGWVAEIPASAGCHALMDTREEAIAELANVLLVISEVYQGVANHFPSTPPKSCLPSARAEDFRRVAAMLGFRHARTAGSHER